MAFVYVVMVVMVEMTINRPIMDTICTMIILILILLQNTIKV